MSDCRGASALQNELSIESIMFRIILLLWDGKIDWVKKKIFDQFFMTDSDVEFNFKNNAVICF